MPVSGLVSFSGEKMDETRNCSQHFSLFYLIRFWEYLVARLVLFVSKRKANLITRKQPTKETR